MVALEPLGLGLAEVPVPPAAFALLDVGVGDAGAFATVTVGPLTVAVSGEPLPSGTETVAVNLIVSPAGAVFGTLTEASICGAEGCAAGRVKSQLVFVGLLAQLSTVKTGWLNAGLAALGVRVVAIVPFSAEVDQAEMRNRTVPPGCTLVPEAVTSTAGFVGVAVAVGVGVGVGVGVEVGVAVGADELAVAVGAAAVDVAAVDVAAVADAAALEDATLADGEVEALALLDAPVADGVAVADGEAAARAVPLIPLEITKIPVAARPSVTGRA
jgi:hypothetical protein